MRGCSSHSSTRWASTRWISLETTAAGASPRSSRRCTRSGCGVSPSPTAMRTTTGRRRRSSHSSPWRPRGGLRGALEAMLADKSLYRSPQALGPAYEHPERLTDESIETYLRPLVRTEQRLRDFQRFLAAFDNVQTVRL